MRSLILLLVLSLFLACGSSTRGPAQLDSPEITINLSGAPAGKVILVGQYTDQQFQADTAQADASGTVTFKREEPYRPGFYFAYFNDGSAVQLLIDTDQTFTLTSNKIDVPGQMKVAGSVDNQLLYEGLRFEESLGPDFSSIAQRLQSVRPGDPVYNSLQAERQALVDRRMAYFEQVFEEHPNTFYTAYKRSGQNPKINTDLPEDEQVAAYLEEFWDNVDFTDERLLRTPVIANKLERYIKELTPQNAEALIAASDNVLGRALGNDEYYQYIANWIALQYEPGQSQVMDAEAVHVHLIQNYFTRERAFWSDSMQVYGLQQRADQMAHSLIGQPGPDITVPGLDGQPKRLYDEDAPYVIVYMYNPDCEHCIEETPKLVSWYRQNRNRADVYAIALDTEPAKWQNFVNSYGLQNWTNVHDPTNRSIFKTYYVDNTPELYVLNRDRKIIAKNLKPEQIDQAIELAESK